MFYILFSGWCKVSLTIHPISSGLFIIVLYCTSATANKRISVMFYAECGSTFMLCQCFALLFLQNHLVVLLRIHIHLLLRTVNKNNQRCMKMKVSYSYDIYTTITHATSTNRGPSQCTRQKSDQVDSNRSDDHIAGMQGLF